MRVFSAFLLPIAAARTLELFHRVLPPSTAIASSTDGPEWASLGSLDVTSASSGLVSLSGHADIDSIDLGRSRTTDAGERGWWQVKWQGEDGEVMGSTRACFLTSPPTIELFLQDDYPTSLSVRTAAPASGQCYSTPPSASFIHSLKVEVRRAGKVIGPRSAAPAAPQPTNAQTGLPEAPPPEKSFLQKYWMPMLGLGVFIIGQMATPPPPQGGAKRD